MPQPQDPKKKGLAVLIGIGPSKRPAGPPPKFGSDGPMGHDEPDADDMGGPPDGDADDGANGPKSTPEDAHCFTADYRCANCQNYIHDSHECTEVQGNNFGTEILGCVDHWEPEGAGAPGQGSPNDQADGFAGSGGGPQAPAPGGQSYGQ